MKTYQKEYDSLQQAFNQLKKEKEKIKTIYLEGKETVRYITQERINKYTDTICAQDLYDLKNQLENYDNLTIIQDSQIVNNQILLSTTEKIIMEQDYQLSLYKKRKPQPKLWGIGIIGRYGTDFHNGYTPLVGIGLSYNFIRF